MIERGRRRRNEKIRFSRQSQSQRYDLHLRRTRGLNIESERETLSPFSRCSLRASLLLSLSRPLSLSPALFSFFLFLSDHLSYSPSLPLPLSPSFLPSLFLVSPKYFSFGFYYRVIQFISVSPRLSLVAHNETTLRLRSYGLHLTLIPLLLSVTTFSPFSPPLSQEISPARENLLPVLSLYPRRSDLSSSPFVFFSPPFSSLFPHVGFGSVFL